MGGCISSLLAGHFTTYPSGPSTSGRARYPTITIGMVQPKYRSAALHITCSTANSFGRAKRQLIILARRLPHHGPPAASPCGRAWQAFILLGVGTHAGTRAHRDTAPLVGHLLKLTTSTKAEGPWHRLRLAEKAELHTVDGARCPALARPKMVNQSCYP